MVRATPVLILTRPEPQSRAFLAEVEDRLGQPVTAIITPILRIQGADQRPDLDGFKTLILTSGNGVQQVADMLAGREVATVGQQTALLAERAGAHATCLGNTVEDFLNRASSLRSPALHIRGEHSRGDLAQRLTASGVATDECIAYRQIEEPISEEARRALTSGNAVVPVFSPRSARLLCAYECDPTTRVLAISQATAEEWSAPGLIDVADQPNRQAMLDLVVRAL
jgi:uroporphyrinogen-III synthase